MPLLGGHSVTIPQFAGPILVGYFLNWALLGVLNVQVYLYHVTFTRDPIVMQCLVYGILLFEWVQTGLLTAGAFEVFVYRYGDVEALGLVYNGWFSLPIMCALVSMVVQWFFAWRIYMLSKLRILMGGIIILSLLQGICGIVVGAKFKTVSSTAVGIFADAYLPTVLIIWLVGSAVVDVVIAVTMTILMVRRKTGIQQTDKMVNKLIRLIVETGTLTATIAIVGLSLIVAFPGILYYEPALQSLAKLYSNTFVTNLLNRAYVNSTLQSDLSNAMGHINLSLVPVAQDLESAEDYGAPDRIQGGDRSVAYPIQIASDFVLNKQSI